MDDGRADHSPRAAGTGTGRAGERGGYYPSCIRVRPGQVIVPKVHSEGNLPTTATDSPYTFPSRRRTPQSAGTSCNVWAIGRDKSAWDGANTVIPERFLNDEATDFKGKHFDLVPFGSGRRWCPGMQLGLHTIELAVAQLVHCFSWSLSEGLNPSEMDMTDVFGLAEPSFI